MKPYSPGTRHYFIAALFALAPATGYAVEIPAAPVSDRAYPQLSSGEPAIDPAVRAIVIGLLASLLREAAESPDPLAALGDAFERKLKFALRSPEFGRLLQGLLGHAVKDLPSELREPLSLFAQAMMQNMRREMLQTK
jgi:hypothetical protein